MDNNYGFKVLFLYIWKLMKLYTLIMGHLGTFIIPQ